jgi:hypothetical protein
VQGHLASLANAIDGVFSLDLRLLRSDDEQGRGKLIEINSPDSSSPVLITDNSVITKHT